MIWLQAGLTLHQISIKKASRYLEKGGINAHLPALRQVSRPFHHITWHPRSSQWEKCWGFFSVVRRLGPTKYRQQVVFLGLHKWLFIYLYIYIYGIIWFWCSQPGNVFKRSHGPLNFMIYRFWTCWFSISINYQRVLPTWECTPGIVSDS